MRKALLVPQLLILLFISSCNYLTSENSETITVECTEENIDTRYSEIQTLVNAIDKDKINNEIVEKYTDIKKEKFTKYILSISKVTKTVDYEEDTEDNSSIGSYEVFIGIHIDYENSKPSQIAHIMNHYKKRISEMLVNNGINLELPKTASKS